jgi:SH3 domain protein
LFASFFFLPSRVEWVTLSFVLLSPQVQARAEKRRSRSSEMTTIRPKAYTLIISTALGLSLMSQTGWAYKAYVTDSFRISLRRGPSIENKILKFIPSGQPLKVLESQEGWSRVKASESEEGMVEGWVLSRYLITRAPWQRQAESLKQDNTRLKEEIALVSSKASKERGRTRDVIKDYEATLKTVQTVTQKNESLRSSERNKWFVTGALALLFGLIMGRMVGKQRRAARQLFF